MKYYNNSNIVLFEFNKKYIDTFNLNYN